MKTNCLYLCLFLFLVPAFTVSAQKPAKIKTSVVNLIKLPKGVSYTGNVVYSTRWKDKAGEHLFIATESDTTLRIDSAGVRLKSAYLTARHYLLQDSTVLTWTESDSVTDCQHMLYSGFVRSQFNVTDMDKDGVAEVWMMIRKFCRSDTSPADLQLVIHEREQRYTMIGTEKTRLSKTDVIGGEFDINNEFREGQKLFLEKAKNVWHQYGKHI
jgi:hypothetical protein